MARPHSWPVRCATKIWPSVLAIMQDGVANLLRQWQFDFPAILASHSHSVLGPKQLRIWQTTDVTCTQA